MLGGGGGGPGACSSKNFLGWCNLAHSECSNLKFNNFKDYFPQL